MVSVVLFARLEQRFSFQDLQTDGTLFRIFKAAHRISDHSVVQLNGKSTNFLEGRTGTTPRRCRNPSKVDEYLIRCLHDGTQTSSTGASTTCSETVEAQTGSAHRQMDVIRPA